MGKRGHKANCKFSGRGEQAKGYSGMRNDRFAIGVVEQDGRKLESGPRSTGLCGSWQTTRPNMRTS